MLTPAAALDRIFALLPQPQTDTVALRHASDRVLLQPAVAGRDQPPFPASAMDGYALRAADLLAGLRLQVIGQSRAGSGFGGSLAAGQAVRIFTGAPVPAGADMVLIQEDADRAGDFITPRPGHDNTRNIRAQGSDFAKGAVFAAPKRLLPADIGLLAAMNLASVTVARRPVIALLATGDELVNPGDTPGPNQIIASNGLALAALAEAQGAEARLLPIAGDTAESLRAALALAAGADLVVTIGGASVGDHDLVQETAVSAGLKLDFWKVAMRPGKPLIAGKLGQAAFLGLPGNPVSALVCGHLFLRPAIDAMLGLPAAPLARLSGTLSRPIAANGPREHYMRASTSWREDGWLLTPASAQDSSQLATLTRSNALIVAPPGQPAQPEGARAEFIPI